MLSACLCYGCNLKINLLIPPGVLGINMQYNAQPSLRRQMCHKVGQIGNQAAVCGKISWDGAPVACQARVKCRVQTNGVFSPFGIFISRYPQDTPCVNIYSMQIPFFENQQMHHRTIYTTLVNTFLQSLLRFLDVSKLL